MNISANLDTSIAQIKYKFLDCGDIVGRRIQGSALSGDLYITYIDGLVNRSYIEEQLLKNVVVLAKSNPPLRAYGGIIQSLVDSGVSSADIKETETIEDAATAMMSGDCVIFAEQSEKALVLSAKGWPNRGIGQPETEMVLQGSKEAFTETLRMNTALIRRRIRDTNLKIKQIKTGRRSKTDIAVVYLEDVVRKKVLDKVLEKITSIDIDAILDSGYLEQMIEDNKFSPFPQTQVTERPDRAAAAVLEGRIAVIVDNSPFVILVPATVSVFFQSPEDYYQRFEIMSFLRIIRYVSAFIALALPGLYIALTVYHPAMIPSALALKMAAARASIPFPAVVEVLIMVISFELLSEAGIRLPGPIGSTLGIVGGLIMGQAAVEAGIVSPVVVIIVALSGIASFAIPQQSFVSGLRISKFYVILLSSMLGLFGFWLSILSIMTHIVSLKSFGIPYTFPYGCSDMNNDDDMKDSIVRFPIFKMINRPFFASPDERKRFSPPKRDDERREE